MQKIAKAQQDLIKVCRNYLTRENQNNIDVDISPLCFFTVWADTPGRYKVFDLLNEKKISKYSFILKNIFSISKDFDLKLYESGTNIKPEINTVIISYSKKSNFDKKGNFNDSYFGFSSKNKNFFWFLISLDNYVPKKIKHNISIVAKKSNNSISISYLIKFLSKNFFSNIFSIKRINHYCWREFNFSKRITELFYSYYQNSKVKNVILNYEGIPFQNNLLKKLKEKNKKIKTLGYLHCAPWPVQLDLLYKKQQLDYLLVSSLDQKKVLHKYLGWKNKNITVIPSLRFIKNKKKEFNGYLFVPYNLDTGNDYLLRLEEYLINQKNKNFKNMIVRLHPLNQKSLQHIKFKKDAEKILSKYKNNLSPKTTNNLSLFFGSATGVCVQALEEGSTIIHFPNNIYLDVFSSEIWPSLKVNRINSKIFEYKIIKKNKTFFVNSERNKFKKYFTPYL